MSFGLFGFFVAVAMRGQRRTLLVFSWLFLFIALLLAVLLVLFALDLAPALQAGQGAARLGLKKAILKTGMLDVGFAALFVAGGIAGLRQARRTRP